MTNNEAIEIARQYAIKHEIPLEDSICTAWLSTDLLGEILDPLWQVMILYPERTWLEHNYLVIEVNDRTGVAREDSLF